MTKILISLIFLMGLWGSLTAQIEKIKVQHSPEGMMEAIFDKDGRKYTLDDIKIPKSTNKAPIASPVSCGYFNLYFETGCGMEDNANTIHAERRNVLCQLFSDVSLFIQSPLNDAGSTTKVNIWIRNINNLVPNASSTNILAGASSFYNLPAIPNSTGGIVDNQVAKTIISGRDAYINSAMPLVLEGGGPMTYGQYFYHGYMAFNFSSSVNWFTNLSANPTTIPYNYTDMYTVALHELTHALGFASLIDQYGNSKLPAYNVYSRYDRFLKDPNGNFLISNNGSSCSMYNYHFNSSASVLTPGCGSSTPPNYCNSSNRYVGSVNVPIYTPSCWEEGSSLSHFEDLCFPNATSPAGNDMYFVMSNAQSGGPTIKRFLKPEERMVLCDLGYNVGTSYGNTVNFNNFNYGGSACAGTNVIGINDGLNQGTFIHTPTAAQSYVFSGLLTNDYFSGIGNNSSTASFECLEEVGISTSTISPTSGNNSTPISFQSNVLGLHLLRYVPVSADGTRGNITYVFIYVRDVNCTPSSCGDMINNGGFEVAQNCGENYSGNLGCWSNYGYAPIVFTRNDCTTPYVQTNVSTFTSYLNPPLNTHTVPGIQNDNFISLIAENDLLTNNGVPDPSGSTVYHSSAAQTFLNTPLLPGQSYVLSFWATSLNDGITTEIYGVIPDYGILNFSTVPGIGSGLILNQEFPTINPGCFQIPTINIPYDNVWRKYTVEFTFTGSMNHNVLVMWLGQYPQISETNIAIDDVSLKPLAQLTELNLPSTLCVGEVIPNLSAYLGNALPGGVFSGQGVTVSGGVYSFNPSSIGAGNTATITYVFTNSLGCQEVVSDEILINTTISNSEVAYSAVTLCLNQSTILTATGATNYVWQPGNLPGASITVTPTTTTTYTVTASTPGCTAQVTSITVQVLPLPTITGTSTVCQGTNVQLTGSGTPSISTPWLSSNTTVATISSSGLVNTLAAGTTTITYTNSSGCSKTMLLTVNPKPTISGSFTICKGKTSQLTGSGIPASSTPWLSSNTSVATVSSSGLVSAINVGTTTITYTNSNGCQKAVTITVLSTPTISGNLTICKGSTSQLTGSASPASSNAWTLSNPNVASISTNGLVTALVPGTSLVTYTNSNGCSVSATLTIKALPVISGNLSICKGSTSQLSGTGIPVTTNPWTSSNTSVATVSSTGLVNAINAGTATITYSNTTGCSATATVTITNCSGIGACFNFSPSNQLIGSGTSPSPYGDFTVPIFCGNVKIDGNCSYNESGYHIRLCEFDLTNWEYIGTDLYSGWVAPTGTAPDGISLTNLALSNNRYLVEGKLYIVTLSVGAVWTSAPPQFFRYRCPKGMTTTNNIFENLSSVEIIPNPNNGLFTVELNDVEAEKIVVYNMQGKMISETTISDESNNPRIDISMYPAGIYMIRINTEEGEIISRKIMKE